MQSHWEVLPQMTQMDGDFIRVIRVIRGYSSEKFAEIIEL